MAIALTGHLCQASAGCHIHAPDDYPSFTGRPLVIPVNGSRSDCQSLNRTRFGGGGRCHCFTKTPLGAENPGDFDSTDRPNELERLLP